MLNELRYRIRAALIVGSVSAATLVAQNGQPLPIGTRIPVHVQVMSSPAEQLKYCSTLVTNIQNAPSKNTRFAAIGEVMANLAVVAKTWPTDTTAVIQSYLMQADTASRWKMPRNAVDAMSAAAPLARSTAFDHEVQRRLGQFLDTMGRFNEAEQHFLAAEASPSLDKANRIEAQNTLQAIAIFYAHQNRPRDAMKRFQKLSSLPGQTPVNRAAFTLSALKEAVRIRNDPQHSEARGVASVLDERIAEARGDARTPDDVLLIDSISRDAARLRSLFHL